MTLPELASIYTDLVLLDSSDPEHEHVANDEVGVLRSKHRQLFMNKLQEDGVECVDRFDAARKAFELVHRSG